MRYGFVPGAAPERRGVVDVGKGFAGWDRHAEERAYGLPALFHVEDEQPIRRSDLIWRLMPRAPIDPVRAGSAMHRQGQ